MKYKFYIYKQNKPVITFNKYDLDDYVLIREVTNNSQWGLKIERDKEFYTVIRRKFNGQITLSGEDYNTLISFERDTEQYAVVITRECSGIWSEFWKGYFSYFDYKVDMDRCYLTFEPEVWDEYSTVYDQMPIERNAVAADVDHTAIYTSFEYPFEEVNEVYIEFVNPVPVGYAEYTGFPAGNLYYTYSKESLYGGHDEILGDLFTSTYTYRRDYAITNDNVNPPDIDPDWVLDPLLPGPGEYDLGLGQYKWVRPYLSLNGGTATFTHTVSGKDEFWQLDTTASENITLYGLKLLSKVLEFYADYCGLTYTSNFFNDTPCPLGGRTLKLTMIQQISNLRAFGQQAIKGMLKLKDLLSWIRDTFDAYWYIDSNGDFRIEHKRYFEYGLSYTVPAGITMDLGVLYPENLLKLRRYEWSKPELFRFEKLEFQYSNYPDWIDGRIEYTQSSITGNETMTKTVVWGTDINNMYAGREDMAKIGWALYDVYLTGTIVLYYKIVNTVGAISGVPIQNGRFSSANILAEFWTWGRLLPEGKVNGVDTTFDSIDRLKKQVEISFPQCCDEVDYNGIFRTPLGDGMLDSAEYESKSGNLKVQLIYE